MMVAVVTSHNKIVLEILFALGEDYIVNFNEYCVRVQD